MEQTVELKYRKFTGGVFGLASDPFDFGLFVLDGFDLKFLLEFEVKLI